MSTPFSIDDIYLYETISDIDYAPASGQVAFGVVQADREADAGVAQIWVTSTRGAGSFRLSAGPQDSTPRWSPNGRWLAFLSDGQIWLSDASGADARQLSALPSGATSIAWSPDGGVLLACCTLNIDPDARDALCDESGAPWPDDAPKVIWRLPYKLDGTGYTLKTRSHLFLVDARTGEHRQLSSGPFDVRSALFSPDGETIVYARTRVGRFAHRTDVWTMRRDGSDQRQLTTELSNVLGPTFSPDGASIAFAGSIEAGDAQMRLWRIALASGKVAPLGDASLELQSGNPICWRADSTALLAVVSRHGRQEIVSVSVPEGRVTRLVTGDRHVSKLAAVGEALVYVSESLDSANDVYCCAPDGSAQRRITDINAWWRTRGLPVMQMFEVPDGDGGTERIEGWLLLPSRARGPVPLLVDAHGGSTSVALVAYASHAYWNVLVSRGWAVLALNPVGSSSYGRAFADRLRGRWGVIDLEQHLAAVDALRREGIADARVAIAGKSYGGFMSAWSIGQTNAFRAAVVCAPVTNLESHYGTSDGGYYVDTYSMLGSRSARAAQMRSVSPVSFAANVRTPTLILQGEQDQRCPQGQAEELYAAIMSETPAPAEMVLYPGGDHHFFESGKPSHRTDAARRLVDWVCRWVDVPAAPDEGAHS
jgi:dipeptidyl aminopeptidase/acylaminoacyl peptidase